MDSEKSKEDKSRTVYWTRRYLHKSFQDSMTIVRATAKPNFFLTFTTNPNWIEIQRELLPGQTANDRPDLVLRVFHMKLKELLKDLLQGHVFGKVISYMYVVEFQMRGLPHAHILLILALIDRLRTSDQYDKVVQAEIPDPKTHPRLYEIVMKFMIHGPCGEQNPKCSCMKKKKGKEKKFCKAWFPKKYQEHTTKSEYSYPLYRRRSPAQGGIEVIKGTKIINNQWVVPYNPFLLLKYNAHINVEICASIKAVKYLYKYLYKGFDRTALSISRRDETKRFEEARCVGPIESLWRLFQGKNQYLLHEKYPPVQQLVVHEEGRHQVLFNEEESKEVITEIMEKSEYTRMVQE